MIRKKLLISEEDFTRIFEGSLDFQRQKIANSVYYEIMEDLRSIDKKIDTSKEGYYAEEFKLETYNGFRLILEFVFLTDNNTRGSFTPPNYIRLYFKPLKGDIEASNRFRTLNDLFSSFSVRSTFIHEFTHLMDETRAPKKIFNFGYFEFYKKLEEISNESERARESFEVKYLDLLKQVERIYKKYNKSGKIKSNIYLPRVERPNRDDYDDEGEYEYANERYSDSFKIYLFHNAEVNARFHSVVDNIVSSLITGLQDFYKRGDKEELEIWAEFFVHKNLKAVMNDFKSKIRSQFNNILPSKEIMKKLYGRFYVILKKISKAYQESGVELFK